MELMPVEISPLRIPVRKFIAEDGHVHYEVLEDFEYTSEHPLMLVETSVTTPEIPHEG